MQRRRDTGINPEVHLSDERPDRTVVRRPLGCAGFPQARERDRVDTPSEILYHGLSPRLDPTSHTPA
jgi:hypothetical protein